MTSTSSSSHTAQARTVIGPLTTTFTPPPSCTIAAAQCEYCSQGWRAQTCNGDNNIDATDCWPPASSGAPAPVVPFEGWGFYSPGLICPAGYTSACSATGPNDQQSVQYSLLPGETAIGCCPTGFTCASGAAQTCQSVAATSQSFLVDTCTNSAYQGTTLLTMPLDATYAYVQNGETVSTSTTISAYTILNPRIEIRYQSSDVPAGFFSSSSSTSTPTTTSTSSSTSTGPSGGGLSTGVQAAIGVVVPVVVLAALAAGFLVWRSRRRARNAGAAVGAGSRDANDGYSSTFASQGYRAVDQKVPVEMGVYETPLELESNVRAELCGSDVPEAMARTG